MNAFTCFLIDDDAEDREIFTSALADVEGSHSCFVAGDGVEALKTLNGDVNLIPDFIFLDLDMPYMDGKECLQKIKAIPRLATVPVIIYSDLFDAHVIGEALELGATHVMPKPENMNVLTKLLSRLFFKRNFPFVIEWM